MSKKKKFVLFILSGYFRKWLKEIDKNETERKERIQLLAEWLQEPEDSAIVLMGLAFVAGVEKGSDITGKLHSLEAAAKNGSIKDI